MVKFPVTAALEGIRLTVLLFPIDEVSDMDDIAATVEELGARVDWVVLRNPVRQARTKFFDGSELEGILTKELKAAALTLPALLSDTRNYLRALEIRVGRVITPTEALKNPELAVDMTHRMILETWLRDAFRNFDAIAAHLLPPFEAAKIQTAAPVPAPEAKKRGRSINLAEPRMSEREPDPAAPAQPIVPDYWRAAISALPPEKRDAAWDFFQERGLHASAARDTLSGLVLLMEANGLFMDACAQRVQSVMQQEGAAAPAPPVDSKRLIEELGKCNRNLERLEQQLVFDGPADQ